MNESKVLKINYLKPILDLSSATKLRMWTIYTIEFVFVLSLNLKQQLHSPAQPQIMLKTGQHHPPKNKMCMFTCYDDLS